MTVYGLLRVTIVRFPSDCPVPASGIDRGDVVADLQLSFVALPFARIRWRVDR